MSSFSNLDRRRFLTTAAAGAVSLGQSTTRAQQDARLPNVVIIMSDDQGYGDAGCYGASDVQTPHIDALAASGVRFTSFYANAPMCSPTRASLLTGRYPYRCGVPFVVASAPNVVGLKGSEVTLAKLLKQRGYRTACFGKWHLGSHPQSLPNSHGFDEFYGFRSGCVDYYSHRFYWGLGAGLPSFHDLYHNGEEVFEQGSYLTDVITRESKRFIQESVSEDNSAAGKQAAPFFLFVSYNSPHYPMDAPRRYLQRFPGMEPERRMHAAMIAAMDDGIGEIMATLKSTGQLENTLVIFQSDNGATIEERAGLGGRNTPYRGYKFSLFEGGIRVPAALSWPGVVPRGIVIGEPAASMDIFPTVAKLAGSDIPDDRVIDGKDLWPMITEGAKSPHEALFWKRYDQVAVRKGDWKLVLNPILALGEKHRLRGDDRVFLSNLKEDAREVRNLRAFHPEIVEELTEMCRRWELEVEAGG